MDFIFSFANIYKMFVDGLFMKWFGFNLDSVEGIALVAVGVIGFNLLGNLFSEISNKIK